MDSREFAPAQRKFATVERFHTRRRYCGLSKKVTMKKAKTEDFLTFLCLRGELHKICCGSCQLVTDSCSSQRCTMVITHLMMLMMRKIE
jgi:hypothetical protein